MPVKDYYLAPNFTTAPPPEGPIKLGHILRNFTEFDPINWGTAIEIPKTELNPVDCKHGFTTLLSKLHSAELGLSARVLHQRQHERSECQIVARGASFTSSTSRSVAVEADSGLAPPKTSASTGVKASNVNSTEECEKWDCSTDFIMAFKVRKIWYHCDEVKNQPDNKKAVMQDGSSFSCEPASTIRWNDELSDEELSEMLGTTDKGD
ncbi:hypothetical protein B0T10DRAFT_566792 [Thelonectria olida]|uniref:Uncharacterized protein n=1 Tax=Thelonectria olida TaxID=1576542 RepID=A0A9P9AGF2_9HYPO|nr:hypothetical protein B0T10DRAFT_566792 [Thelonectria olida]